MNRFPIAGKGEKAFGFRCNACVSVAEILHFGGFYGGFASKVYSGEKIVEETRATHWIWLTFGD